MGAKVVITFEGLDRTISRLDSIGEKAETNLQTQVRALAHDTQEAWNEATPRRTGRLQGGNSVSSEELSFTLQNGIRYYPFVDEGHNTPAGWRTRHGYRPAKRRSHVEGREMTQKAIEFVEENIEDYLSKFLDNA